MPYFVKALKVSGFRGFNGPQEFDFSRDLVFLFGNNGTGKSSTLLAIEWCLFGDVVFIRYAGRAHDELVSAFQNECAVELVLHSSEGNVTLRRSKSKGREKTAFGITLQDGTVLEDQQAEHAVFRLFGLGLEDFIRSAFLHQESIRGLFTDDPAERDAALDRLFGLDSLRNITEGLRKTKISDRQKGLQGRITEIESRISGGLAEAQRRLEDGKKRGRALGLADNQFAIDQAAKLTADAARDLARLATDAGFDPPSIEPPTSTRTASETVDALRGYVRRVRSKLPEQTKIDEVTQTRTAVGAVLSQFTAAASELATRKQALKGFEKEKGDSEGIAARVSSATKRVDSAEAEKAGVTSRFKVIRDALPYLRKTDVAECPVCGQRINREALLDTLRAGLDTHEAEDVKRIQDKIEKAEQDRTEAERDQREHKRLSGEVSKAQRDLDGVIKQAAAALQRVLTPKDDVEAVLKARVAEFDADLKRLAEPLKQREIQFQRAEDRCDRLAQIVQVLEETDRIKKLEELLRSEELESLRRSIIELESLREIVEIIATAVATVQTNLAGVMIANARDAMSEYYGRLCNHPYYKELQIEVEPKSVKGGLRNAYHIKALNEKDGEGTVASQRFSTGQLNSLALAIYLALGKKNTYSHKLGFTILDDPSQSLDPSHKESLADVLIEQVPQKQVILATQDRELQSMLRERAHDKPVLVYQFDTWGKEGPQFRLDS